MAAGSAVALHHVRCQDIVLDKGSCRYMFAYLQFNSFEQDTASQPFFCRTFLLVHFTWTHLTFDAPTPAQDTSR